MTALLGFALGVAAAAWWYERYQIEREEDEDDEGETLSAIWGGSSFTATTGSDCELRLHRWTGAGL